MGRFWNQEHERNLGDLRRRLRKVTKKQLRDFRIISEEIS